MDPSLPDNFEQMPVYAHYGSGAQNNNTGGGIQHNNSWTGHQNSGSGIMVIGNNYNVHYGMHRSLETSENIDLDYMQIEEDNEEEEDSDEECFNGNTREENKIYKHRIGPCYNCKHFTPLQKCLLC